MKYPCRTENCNLVFNRPSKLLRHELLHTGIKIYQCPGEGCTKSYSTPSHLNRHLKSHGRDVKKQSSFRCSYPRCQAVYDTKWGLQRHEKKHENVNHCEICEFRFKDVSNYLKHMDQHRNKWTQVCKKCGKNYTHATKQKYRIHESRCGLSSIRRVFRNPEEDIFICDQCQCQFNEKKKLKEHIVACYSLHSSMFICGYESCTRMFFYKRNLRHHIERHKTKKLLRHLK